MCIPDFSICEGIPLKTNIKDIVNKQNILIINLFSSFEN